MFGGRKCNFGFKQPSIIFQCIQNKKNIFIFLPKWFNYLVKKKDFYNVHDQNFIDFSTNRINKLVQSSCHVNFDNNISSIVYNCADMQNLNDSYYSGEFYNE